MRPLKYFFIVLIMIPFVLFSCKDDTIIRKKITGKAGEVVVVIPTETWDGTVGESMRKVLAQPQSSLPQEEPIFDLIDVPPVAFKDVFQSSRNIIKVNISSTVDSTRVRFVDDVYAWPQAVVELQAKSPEEMITLFNESSNQILSYLLRAERERLLINYNKYYDKAVRNTIENQFNFKLSLPAGFVVAKQEDDFAWFRYDTPKITQGVSIYTFPYTSEKEFTQEFLISKRDSLLKKHIEASVEGSYITTEHLFAPTFDTFRFKNNYATLIRGLWKSVNDFMGGAFVNLAVLDISNKRVIMLDGFLYAPDSDKRNFVRQLEAMLYSLELPNQAENDKITSEINMGN